MEKLFPYALVSTTVFLASVVVLFVYLRRRAGGWLALAGVLTVLFMGTAREVLVWPFEVSFTASMATGIAALLALEGEDRRGDAIACGLLVLGLAFSELALFFAVGAAVSMVVARRPWSRAYVVVVPVLLYAGWLPAGATRPRAISRFTTSSTAPSTWPRGSPRAPGRCSACRPRGGSEGSGRLCSRSRARGAARALTAPLPATFWSALAVLLCFWVLTAASFEPGREPDQRDTSTWAACCFCSYGERLRRVRLKARETLAVLAVACVATIANLAVLRHDYALLAEPRDRLNAVPWRVWRSPARGPTLT